jgi:adenylate cyclase
VTREELFARLDEANRDTERAAEIEAAIWREAGHHRAILVSDLSGFTKTTKRKGILHFLGIFRQVVAFAEPLFARSGARFWKTSADNMLASFDRVEAALDAARGLARIEFADGIRCCVGLGYGPILQLENDLFGDEVNIAYKLGEDVAGPGEVLVSSPAAAQVSSARLEGPLQAPVGGLDIPYYRCALD